MPRGRRCAADLRVAPSSAGGTRREARARPADAGGHPRARPRPRRLLRPGDLVVLVGPLGAGKTALTQGIGAGLGVRSRSPRRRSSSPASTAAGGCRWCTSTPTGWAASPTSTTSTSTRPPASRSPSWSGGRAWSSSWPTSTWRCGWTGGTTTSGPPSWCRTDPAGRSGSRSPATSPRDRRLSQTWSDVLVLALDTATPTLVAGLADWSQHGVTEVLAERAVPSGNRHAELLTPAISSVLDDAGLTMADLDAVVTGLGPGPFTGLRVGRRHRRGAGRRARPAGDRRLLARRDRLRRPDRGHRRPAQGGLLGDLRRRRRPHRRARPSSGPRSSAVPGPFVGDPAFADAAGRRRRPRPR